MEKIISFLQNITAKFNQQQFIHFLEFKFYCKSTILVFNLVYKRQKIIKTFSLITFFFKQKHSNILMIIL